MRGHRQRWWRCVRRRCRPPLGSTVHVHVVPCCNAPPHVNVCTPVRACVLMRACVHRRPRVRMMDPGSWQRCRCCTGCQGSPALTRTSSPRQALSESLRSATWPWCAPTPALGAPGSKARTTRTTLAPVRAAGYALREAPPRCLGGYPALGATVTRRAAVTLRVLVAGAASGAGFYVNATQQPWAANYNMFDYVTKVRALHDPPPSLLGPAPLP